MVGNAGGMMAMLAPPGPTGAPGKANCSVAKSPIACTTGSAAGAEGLFGAGAATRAARASCVGSRVVLCGLCGFVPPNLSLCA